MTLSGYAGWSGNDAGGVAHIALIMASQVSGVQYDPVEKRFVSITVTPGAGFREYRFREGSASYREVWGEDKRPVVAHELVFRIGSMDIASRTAVEELMRNAPEGVVALVKMESGVILLAGYSPRFGSRQPLRLDKVVGSAGQEPDDRLEEELRFVSRDVDKAISFSGEIPWVAADPA